MIFFLHRNKVRLLRHPLDSPDLNQIENVWAYWKDQIQANLNELRAYNKEEWEKIPLHVLWNTIQSIPTRLKQHGMLKEVMGDHVHSNNIYYELKTVV